MKKRDIFDALKKQQKTFGIMSKRMFEIIPMNTANTKEPDFRPIREMNGIADLLRMEARWFAAMMTGSIVARIVANRFGIKTEDISAISAERSLQDWNSSELMGSRLPGRNAIPVMFCFRGVVTAITDTMSATSTINFSA